MVPRVGHHHDHHAEVERAEWQSYLTDYHNDRPGITEQLLADAVDRHRIRPYPWLIEPLRASSGPILDLACGSAPTRPLLAGRSWLGVDVSAGELAVAAAAGRGPLRARADRLPLGDHTVAAVCAAMCLPVLTPLDAVLAELTRVLAPGGILAALVPSETVWGRGVFDWWRIMRALRVRTLPWPNPRARDELPEVLRACGFVIDRSERRVFRREITGPDDAALVIDGLYLPETGSEQIMAAEHALASWARRGRQLALPLRRVVAHRPTTVR
ncbi:class I SAM-dependent methyltransferase [Nocardia terpenica]|uniref:Methyltransferase domain-containing protein n=1 Tax=Nocardia terpenica TaxID=455432 RepID=A0A6G9Z3A2_9NOCA|nr:methyltransferase domain-containing protein [Nocardia terpenica]QIS19920.1 methyltransferase domain-containing protein [Nocardia terpenica]